MDMKLIKNISPIGISVSISIIKDDGSHATVELKREDSILVNDSSTQTKSIVIQQRKGNIEILNEYSSNLIPYEVNLSIDSIDDDNDEEVSDELVKKWSETFAELKQQKVNDVTPALINELSNSNEPPKNKGGRPKGSFKKKGRGRPKTSKKKKQSKNKIAPDNTTTSNEVNGN